MQLLIISFNYYQIIPLGSPPFPSTGPLPGFIQNPHLRPSQGPMGPNHTQQLLSYQGGQGPGPQLPLQKPLSYLGGQGPGPQPPPPPPSITKQQPASNDRHSKNLNGHLYERQLDSPEPLPPGIDNLGMSHLFFIFLTNYKHLS